MATACSDVRNIFDPADQCTFARENCQLASLIPYGTLVFCHIASKWIRSVFFFAVTAALFSTMGVAAFDYLGPNLTYMANRSGLSQSLMGVTVLALANGSVDVFGAIMAVKSGEGGMAIGEMMGGALFVSSVVVGSMAIVKPFEIDQWCFIRDISALALASIFMLYVASDGIVSLMEGVLAVLFYCIYALLVVQHHRVVDSQEPPSDIESARASPEPVDHEDVPFTPIRPSLYRAVDMGWHVKHELEEIQEAQHLSPIDPTSYTFGRRQSAPSLTTTDAEPSTSAFPVMQNALLPQDRVERNPNLLSPSDLPRLNTEQTTPLSPHAGGRRSSSPLSHYNLIPAKSANSVVTMNEVIQRALESQRIEAGMPPTSDTDAFGPINELETVSDVLLSLLAPGFATWSTSTYVARINGIVVNPVLSLFACSIPRPFYARHWLVLCIYSAAIPLMLPVLLPGLAQSLAVCLLQALSATLGILWWGRLRKPPPSTLTVTTVGFCMSLLWVCFIATELVGVLTILGAVCRVSTSVMGLTIFAIGDSLGDFVSNITVARMGFSTMAVSACFAGPTFVLFFGLGASTLTTMLLRGETEVQIETSSSLVLSGLGLVINLAHFAIMIPRNDWSINRKVGIRSIIIWFIVVFTSVMFFRH